MQTLRKSAGLTAQHVAQKMGVAESTVRNWDKGRSVPTLTPVQYLILLDLYQCSPQDLAGAAGQMGNPTTPPPR
jgi:DNA-binding transcriptional regulator YiaG